MNQVKDIADTSASQRRIAAKHHYRFKYLKSEHWSNLRIEKLASVDACCKNCGRRDLSNDVHHLNYRNLYDVTLSDLVVLCRECHDLAHEALEVCREFIKRASNPWGATRQLMRMIALAREEGLDVGVLKNIRTEKFVNIFWKAMKRVRQKRPNDDLVGFMEVTKKELESRKPRGQLSLEPYYASEEEIRAHVEYWKNKPREVIVEPKAIITEPQTGPVSFFKTLDKEDQACVGRMFCDLRKAKLKPALIIVVDDSGEIIYPANC